MQKEHKIEVNQNFILVRCITLGKVPYLLDSAK